MLSKLFYAIFILLIIMLLTKNLEKMTITRPSKCFSCEKDIIRREGIFNVWKALPTKCIDCEFQAIKLDKDPYTTGPTKCVDCEQQRKTGN